MSSVDLSKLRSGVRDVPDFPKPGILFKDITPILSDPTLFALSIDAIMETVEGMAIDKVVGIDARGFLFAAPSALRLDAGLVLVRKKGKLPWETHALAYALEYGEAEVEIHIDSIEEGERVLLVDDLLATGGTAAAAQQLIQKVGGNLVATVFLIELRALGGKNRLSPSCKTFSLLEFD